MSRDDRYETSPDERGSLDDTALGSDHDEADLEAELQVAELREGIEQTRANLSETIDELQERLSPSNLKDQALESVREATIGRVEDMVERAGDAVYETRRTVVDTIKANPVPAALVGIGLAWMWWNGRGDSSQQKRQYDDRYRGQRGYYAGQVGYSSTAASGASRPTDQGLLDKTTSAAGDIATKTKESVSGLVDQAQDTAGQLANKARETVNDVVDQARHQARRVEDSMSTAMRENPLAVGAVALAIGAAVGLALPQTQKENQIMGEARDNLVDMAQSAAQETMGQFQQVAREVIDEQQTQGGQGAQGQQAGR